MPVHIISNTSLLHFFNAFFRPFQKYLIKNKFVLLIGNALASGVVGVESDGAGARVL